MLGDTNCTNCHKFSWDLSRLLGSLRKLATDECVRLAESCGQLVRICGIRVCIFGGQIFACRGVALRETARRRPPFKLVKECTASHALASECGNRAAGVHHHALESRPCWGERRRRSAEVCGSVGGTMTNLLATCFFLRMPPWVFA